MEFTKQIEYSITVDNPCTFLQYKDKNVLDVITKTFTHTCFAGVFIQKVLSIINISAARIIHSNHKASASINVIFSASVIHAIPGDCVSNVHVNIISKQLIGQHDMYVINIYDNMYIKSLKYSKIPLPIQLTGAQRYNVGKTQIISSGMLLTCKNTFDTYRIKGALSTTEVSLLTNMLNNINNIRLTLSYTYEYKEDLPLTEEKLAYLLYSYKKYNIPKADDISNLMNVDPIDIVIYRDNYVPEETTIIQTRDPVDEIPVEPYSVLLKMLHHTYTFTLCVKDMAEYIKTSDDMRVYDSLVDIWLSSKIQ